MAFNGSISSGYTLLTYGNGYSSGSCQGAIEYKVVRLGNNVTVYANLLAYYSAAYTVTMYTSNKASTVLVDGTKGTQSSNASWNQTAKTVVLASITKTFTPTSNTNVSISGNAYFKSATGMSNMTDVALSGTITITPTTHTVKYNANGGTGAPGNQTKVYGTILTLSTTVPTRDKYTFAGWSTSATGSVEYAAGGKYGLDQDVTLYAVWKMAANCRIKVNGAYKLGMMYKKVNGTYKTGTVKSKVNGVYKDGGLS